MRLGRNLQRSTPWWIAVGLLAAGSLQAQPPDSAGAATRGAPALGASLAPERVSLLGPIAPGSEPLVVRLVVEWASIEVERGSYVWDTVDAAVERLQREGYRTTLVLVASHPLYLGADELPSPLIGDSFDAWLAFTRQAVRRFVGQVEGFEIDVLQSARDRVRDYAYLLKNSALLLRAEAEAQGESVRIGQAPLESGALEWQIALWNEDVAAYIDVLPVVIDPDTEIDRLRGELRDLLVEKLRHPPAPEVWALVRAGNEVRASDEAPALALTALAAGADAALVEVPDLASTAVERVEWLRGTAGLLAAEYAPAPSGDLRLVDGEGKAIPGARVLARFFSADDFSTLVFFTLPGDPDAPMTDRMLVDSLLVRDAVVIDPRSGETTRVGSAPLPEQQFGRSIRVRRGNTALAVRFSQGAASPGFDVPLEQVETTGSRELTAEEIIARHQTVQKVQDDRLLRYTARGRTDFHFKLAQGGGTIDFAFEANYFWEKGGALEWEETDYFFNGNKIPWKRIPDLPLIQPEKVLTLPLDLTFDRTYTYRLQGREKVEGREAFVLTFDPVDADPALNLYRGRLWIDTQTFVLLKTSLLQSGLDPPVLSNEEIDDYAPVAGPLGDEYWLITRIRGQQTWNTVGSTFIVVRELTFTNFEINLPEAEFEERRTRAYASDNKMMRSTDDGARKLERQRDGTRKLNEKIVHAYLFGALGAVKDSSTGGVTPLVGVNYFNYDLGESGIQVNAFGTPVFAFLTGSKPDLIGRRGDGTLNLSIQGIKFQDRLFRDGEEILPERIEERTQTGSFQLGFPAGEFVKLNLIGRLSYNQYFPNDEAQTALDEINMNPSNPGMLEFVLPSDHVDARATLEIEANRRAWTLIGSVSQSRRSEWEPWGLADVTTGQPITCDPATATCSPSEPQALPTSYTRWRLTLFKEWFLAKLQKVRIDLGYLDGRNLDRFSRYRFSIFGGGSLAGFSGSGVRFDRGVIGSTGYNFNLFKAVQFDLVLESGLVEDFSSGSGRQQFTGVGVGLNLVGPWQTLIQLEYGYALASDIPSLVGDQEFQLLWLKLF